VKQIRLTKNNFKSIAGLLQKKGWNLITPNKAANLAIEAGVPVLEKSAKKSK